MRLIVGAMMVIFGLAGVALVWNALKLFEHTWRRLPHLLHAQGTVMRIERRRRTFSSGGRMRTMVATFPVIQFLNHAGELVSFQSAVGDAEPSRYRPGQAIKVRYDPEGQLPPMIDSWSGLWLPVLFQSIGGLVFIGGSVLIWVAFGQRIIGG